MGDHARAGAGAAAEAASAVVDPAPGTPPRGVSNTPSGYEKLYESGSAPYHLLSAGVDQIRVVLSLSGESHERAQALTGHGYRPRGMPNMECLGAWILEGYGRKFRHLLDPGPVCAYHVASASLHVDIHPERLTPLTGLRSLVSGVLRRLEVEGIGSFFPVRVARADVAGDVLFARPDIFAYVFSAFGAMLPPRGREVAPYGVGTLYVRASKSSRPGRLGRVYDKGRERALKGGWTGYPERTYLRIEAEQLWESKRAAPRPTLDELTGEWARATFVDRFGAVGKGKLALKGGLVEPLMQLLHDGQITARQYERLYSFLDHCRMGLAADLYGDRRQYLERAREARTLGLEVPGQEDRSAADLGHELDVRALVEEISLAF